MTTATIELPATQIYRLQERINAPERSYTGHRTSYTLYTIRQSARGFSVATLALESGMLGGMGYFGSAQQAHDVVREAYKTPLIEVNNETFGLWKQQMGVRG